MSRDFDYDFASGVPMWNSGKSLNTFLWTSPLRFPLRLGATLATAQHKEHLSILALDRRAQRVRKMF